MNYLRLPTNIPNTVPPNGFVDVFFNPETHALAVKRSDNSIVGLDAVTQAEVLEALGFTPASAAKFVAGAGKLTGPSSNLTIGTAAAKDVGTGTGQVPVTGDYMPNLTIGTAAAKDVGTGAGQVPVTGDYMPADGAPAAAHAAVATDHTVTLDSALGRYQYLNASTAAVVTLEGKVSPKPVDGQKLYLRINSGTGGCTVKTGTSISLQSLSATEWDTDGVTLAASKTWELLFKYNTDINKWCFMSFTGGFA